MEEEKVDDDHYQDPSDSPFFGDEVKSRVEYHGLSRDHGVPANDYKGCADVVVAAKVKELQQEPRGMNRNSPRSNQKAPEIEPRTSLEGAEDHNVDLNDVVDSRPFAILV
jgi:hypothetical protein